MGVFIQFSEIASWMQEHFAACVKVAEDTYIEAITLDNTLPKPYTILLMQSDCVKKDALSPGNCYMIIGDTISLPDENVNIILIQDKQYTVSQIYGIVESKLKKQAQLNWELARLYPFFLKDNFIEALVDHIYALFGNHIAYSDYSHRILSARGAGKTKIDLWDSSISQGQLSTKYIPSNLQDIVKDLIHSGDHYYKKINGKAYYVWPVTNGKVVYSYYGLLATNRDLSDEDLTIMKRIVDLTLMKLSNNMPGASQGDYSEILKDLIVGGIKDELELDYRLLTQSWKRADNYQVFLIDTHNRNEKVIQYINNTINTPSFNSVKHIIYEFRIVVLLEGTFSQLIRVLSQFCIRSDLKAGISEQFNNLFHFKDYLNQAERAITFGERLNPTNLVHSYKDYQYTDWLTECNEKLACKKYFHPIVEKLEYYDLQNRSDFYTTLLTYLEQGKSINKTCSIMHLHKNTVNYRIQRIKELFDFDYDDGQTTQHIYLSLKVNSLKYS